MAHVAAGGAGAALPPSQQQEHQQEGQPEQQPAAGQHLAGGTAVDSSTGSGSSSSSVAGGAAGAQQQQQQLEQQQQAEQGQQAALSASQQPPLRAEVQLDALERSLAGLHLRRGQLAQLLSRRPSLLRAPPSEGALEAVAEALGGRSELAAAALCWPFVLQSSPGSVQRRIEALMLHARCPNPEVAARMVARHPPLLAAPEQAIAENAR